MGPWIVTPDEIGDPYKLKMEARVNGKMRSQGVTEGMLFSFEEIIAHVTKDETLMPGEFIGSGTVGNGCGLELGWYLEHGDAIELDVDALGDVERGGGYRRAERLHHDDTPERCDELGLDLMADLPQHVSELEHPLELRLVATSPEARVIPILLAAPSVATRRLHVTLRIGRDPHVCPGRRHCQHANPLKVRGRDGSTGCLVHIRKSLRSSANDAWLRVGAESK